MDSLEVKWKNLTDMKPAIQIYRENMMSWEGGGKRSMKLHEEFLNTNKNWINCLNKMKNYNNY